MCETMSDFLHHLVAVGCEWGHRASFPWPPGLGSVPALHPMGQDMVFGGFRVAKPTRSLPDLSHTRPGSHRRYLQNLPEPSTDHTCSFLPSLGRGALSVACLQAAFPVVCVCGLGWTGSPARAPSWAGGNFSLSCPTNLSSAASGCSSYPLLNTCMSASMAVLTPSPSSSPDSSATEPAEERSLGEEEEEDLQDDVFPERALCDGRDPFYDRPPLFSLVGRLVRWRTACWEGTRSSARHCCGHTLTGARAWPGPRQAGGSGLRTPPPALCSGTTAQRGPRAQEVAAGPQKSPCAGPPTGDIWKTGQATLKVPWPRGSDPPPVWAAGQSLEEAVLQGRGGPGPPGAPRPCRTPLSASLCLRRGLSVPLSPGRHG